MVRQPRKRSSSDTPPPAPSWFETLTTPDTTSAFVLTLAFAHTPAQLVYPLFSAAPTESIAVPLHLFLAFVAVVCYALLPLPRMLRWEVHWIALGLVLITTEAVGRLWGEGFMALGVDAGVWVARLAVEGPATVLRWWCVLKGVSASDQVSQLCQDGQAVADHGAFLPQRRSVRVLGALALPVYLAVGWQPAFLQLIPECHIVRYFVRNCHPRADAEPDPAASARSRARARRHDPNDALPAVLDAILPQPSHSIPSSCHHRGARGAHLARLDALPTLAAPPILPAGAHRAQIAHPSFQEEPDRMDHRRRSRERRARLPLPPCRPLIARRALGRPREEGGH